jgi:uncharacterized repeat protein (TIGR01451 family)
MELISMGKGGIQGDSSSYHVSTSADGRIAAFISFSRNWAPDQPEQENWLDVFVRDRENDELIKITYGPNGELTDESSYDPIVSADGRYVSYHSYATNLVPGDTNGHEWLREGIDVFVYDRLIKKTKRVSLNSDGGEIKGNSIGTLTPDGRFVIFVSNGRVITGQSHNSDQAAVYLRDLLSGQVEQISKGIDNLYPNAAVDSARGSFDGRYIVYASGASNLVLDDKNGQRDLFLYDRTTGSTKLFTRALNGKPANGESRAPQITYDGRYIVFLSSATNLVVGDTNDSPDVFVYDVENDTIRRVNVAEDGTQSNGLTKDPSICNTGRFVSFTTDATNLVSGDTNGKRDVIFHDLVTGRNTVATVNESGEWGNRKAHRSYLVPDCRAITFASDATNLVANDTNNNRDLFMGQIYLPADLTPSALTNLSASKPGDTLVYTYTVRNIGYETSSANLVSKVPANTTYLAGSATGGGIFNSADNQVEWQNTVTGESEIKFSYAVIVDASLVDPTLIVNRSLLSSDEWVWMLDGYTVINGWQSYLPFMNKH